MHNVRMYITSYTCSVYLYSTLRSQRRGRLQPRDIEEGERREMVGQHTCTLHLSPGEWLREGREE